MLALTPDGQGRASGRLNLHDTAQLLEFTVNVLAADGTYTITGETTLDYRDWGLKVIRKAGLIKVAPEVNVRFKLVGTLPEGK